jgi:hypothetical protein
LQKRPRRRTNAFFLIINAAKSKVKKFLRFRDVFSRRFDGARKKTKAPRRDFRLDGAFR